MNKANQYLTEVSRLISTIQETQMEAILKAAEKASNCLLKGGMIYTFGTGHSHMLAEEIFYRAGGLVKVYPILDEPLMLHAGAVKSTHMERLEGYASILLDNYPVKEGDVIIVFSNSGRNAAIVEMALEAKARELNVIAITNLTHTTSIDSRHHSGKRLFEIADVVIDNCGVKGDACIKFEDLGMVGPTSTAAGAAILQALVCQVVENLIAKGIMPEVFCSSNVDGGDAINQQLIDRYNKLIKNL